MDAVSKNAQRNQPLHAALALGRNAESSRLLAHGADANATQTGGYTPIFSAATANRKDLAELLVAHGANPQHRMSRARRRPISRANAAMQSWRRGWTTLATERLPVVRQHGVAQLDMLRRAA